MERVLFFDTETTGLAHADRILQFGAVFGARDRQNNMFYEERRINQYIDPKREISEGAQAVHGLSLEFVSRFNPMDYFIKEFLVYISRSDYIVAHNVSFDMRMLKKEVPSQFLPMLEKPKQLCTMRSYKKVHKGKNPKLQELYVKYFEEEFDGAHDAMADILATKDVFFKMVEEGGYFNLNEITTDGGEG